MIARIDSLRPFDFNEILNTSAQVKTHPVNKKAIDALVIGAGPAGLMAAQMLAEAGREVTLVEGRPSPARKLLMAGKSGLNITKEEEFETFIAQFEEASDFLRPMLEDFGPLAVQHWCKQLGQDVFTGTSGRVFPVAMKASPLLRAWLANMEGIGVTLLRNWHWNGFTNTDSDFSTPEGNQCLSPKVTVLAMGGASWPKLGSDGQWANHLSAAGVKLSPFAASNASLELDWSEHMAKHFGQPVKNTKLSAGQTQSRGEFIISSSGLEGSGIYSISKAVRQGHPLSVDLLPDCTLEVLQSKLSRARGKNTLSNYLRKTLGLNPSKLALLQELARPLPPGVELAQLIKHLPIQPKGLSDIDKAISTAGGVQLDAVDASLMLKAKPAVFCAGEMLDWEAPTGGYLLTACLATGRWAGKAAASYGKNSSL